MAIAGRRRVPAGFTNVTYRTVGRLVNRLAAGTDCVPPGTAMSAVPAYEDDDERWYALRTAVPPRLSHRLRRSELLHSEPRACATACVRLSRADPVGSTGRLPPFFRRLPADNGSLPHNGAYRNTPRGQIDGNVHQECSSGMFIFFSFLYSSRAPLSANTLGSFTGDIAHLVQGRLPYGPEKGLLRNDVRFHVDYEQARQGCDCGRWVGNRPRFRSRPAEGRI